MQWHVHDSDDYPGLLLRLKSSRTTVHVNRQTRKSVLLLLAQSNGACETC